MSIAPQKHELLKDCTRQTASSWAEDLATNAEQSFNQCRGGWKGKELDSKHGQVGKLGVPGTPEGYWAFGMLDYRLSKGTPVPPPKWRMTVHQ